MADSGYLPLYASGNYRVFAHVGGVTAECINYCDGDGGSIQVDRFPGLSRYLEVNGIPIHSVGSPSCRLVYFREAFHDAIEAGHRFSVTTMEDVDTLPEASSARPQVTHFGHLALVHARNEIGKPSCGRVLLVPYGVHHGRNGLRLLVEIYTSSKGSDQFVSTGVRRVEDGLSFPTVGAPMRYLQAMEAAIANRNGFFQFGPEMANVQLMPWSLKVSLAEQESVTVHCSDTLTCTVNNSRKLLNECHMMVHPSLLTGAGSGLFIRPTPPTQQDATIPKGAYVCFFSYATAVSEGPASDYELGSTRNVSGLDRVVYDPSVYNGLNIGRFINQGGLNEGIKALVASCNREEGCDSYRPGVAENIFDQHCNVVYTRC